MIRAFLIGVILGAAAVCGGLYYYFSSGMAPAASNDPPMPFERQLARVSLRAHIAKQALLPAPIPADESNLRAGAELYRDNCAGCHGLPGQPDPYIAEKMYPHATLLFNGKGVTDDAPESTYWKIFNGIRLSGMPPFSDKFNATQVWQLSLLVSHANALPESAKAALAAPPVPPPAIAPPQ